MSQVRAGLAAFNHFAASIHKPSGEPLFCFQARLHCLQPLCPQAGIHIPARSPEVRGFLQLGIRQLQVVNPKKRAKGILQTALSGLGNVSQSATQLFFGGGGSS